MTSEMISKKMSSSLVTFQGQEGGTIVEITKEDIDQLSPEAKVNWMLREKEINIHKFATSVKSTFNKLMIVAGAS